MPLEFAEQLDQIHQLIRTGDYLAAREIIGRIEDVMSLPKDKIIGWVFLSQIKNLQGAHLEAIKIANQVLEKIQNIDDPILELDALLQKIDGLIRTGEFKEASKLLKKYSILVHDLQDYPKEVVLEKKSELAAYEAWICYGEGKISSILEHAQLALKYAEEINDHYLICSGKILLFLYFYHIREIKEAKKIAKETLEIAKTYGFKHLIAIADWLFARCENARAKIDSNYYRLFPFWNDRK